MKKLLSLILVVAMVMSLVACGGDTKETTATPGTTAEQGQTTPDTTTPANPNMDPALYGGDFNVRFAYLSNSVDVQQGWGLFANRQWSKCIYETALGLGADCNLYPLICTYKMSDDGQELTLTLRDYYFSDGTKVTIEDVASSAQRMAVYQKAFREAFFGHVIEEKIDGNNLIYKFDCPGPLYLYYAGYSFVVSKKSINDAHLPEGFKPFNKDHIEDYGQAAQDCMILDEAEVIGTGPYMLDTYEPDTQILLKRNPNYVTFENGGNGMGGPKYAYPDAINFLVNLDATSSAAAMVNGDYDIGGVTADLESQAIAAGCKLNLMPNQWTHAIFFNLSEYNKDSIVNNLDFRKAVLYAIDPTAVLLAIFPSAERFYLDPSAVSPLNTTYFNHIFEEKAYNCYDVEKAKEYLKKSGYDGKEEIVYLTNQSGAFYNATMTVIPYLEAIGIKVKLWSVDGGSHGTLRGDPKNEYDIGCWETQKGEYLPINCTNLCGMAKSNGWDSAKRDEYVNIIRTTPYGSAESVKAYEDLCNLIAEEQPFVVFGTGRTGSWVSKWVDKLNYEGTDAYYWNISVSSKLKK